MVSGADDVAVLAVLLTVYTESIENRLHVGGQGGDFIFRQRAPLELFGDPWSAGIVFQQTIATSVQSFVEFIMKRAGPMDKTVEVGFRAKQCAGQFDF